MAIMSLYQQVTVTIEILYVNRIPFLISISLNLNFGTVERLKKHRVPTLVKNVRTIKKTYALQDFNLVVINMDTGFEPLRTAIYYSNILLKICA